MIKFRMWIVATSAVLGLVAVLGTTAPVQAGEPAGSIKSDKADSLYAEMELPDFSSLKSDGEEDTAETAHRWGSYRRYHGGHYYHGYHHGGYYGHYHGGYYQRPYYGGYYGHHYAGYGWPYHSYYYPRYYGGYCGW